MHIHNHISAMICPADPERLKQAWFNKVMEVKHLWKQCSEQFTPHPQPSSSRLYEDISL